MAAPLGARPMSPVRACLLRLVVMLFEQQAAFLGAERPVRDVRRAHAIGEGAETLAALGTVIADPHVTFEDKDLFPVIMFERNGGVGARFELQQAGVPALAVLHVQRARHDLLLDPRGIALGRLPARLHVKLVELAMFLVHGHFCVSLVCWVWWCYSAGSSLNFGLFSRIVSMLFRAV